MAAKKSWVSFVSATPVPGSVLDEPKDRRMKIGEPVQLPAAYAAQMIESRFAVACDAPATATRTTRKTDAKTTSKKAAVAASGTAAVADPTGKATADQNAAANAVSDPTQASLNMGDKGAGTADPLSVEDAQAAYDQIAARMEELTEDEPEWQVLKVELDDAATALAAAQDAGKAGA